MYVFGPGVLIGTLAGGTPVNIGYAQEITYSEKADLKELYGQNRRPLAVGGGTIKSTVKVKLARISSLALAQLWIGIQPTPGGTFASVAEPHTLGSLPALFRVCHNVESDADGAYLDAVPTESSTTPYTVPSSATSPSSVLGGLFMLTMCRLPLRMI